MATKEKKKYIGAMIPVSLADKLKIMADQNRRTVSAQLIVLLAKALGKV